MDALTTVEMNLKLEVGATAESVTVTAAPPELNTADARMGQTMRNEMYTALPLTMGNGNPRNPAAFIYLMPGVQEGGTFGFINGGQSFSKDVYIEGLPITDAVRQGESRAMQFAVSVEAVEQFQVETSGQSVEFNGQGSENYTIKSGTNQFHGSLYEYFRNTVLDARGFFSPDAPAAEPEPVRLHLRRARSSGTSIFFFGAYDGYRYRVATDYRFVTIPTMKMRDGRFQRAAGSRSSIPATTICPGGTNCTRQPFRRQRHSGQPHLFGLQILPGPAAAPDALRDRQQLPQQQHGRRIQQRQRHRQSGSQCHRRAPLLGAVLARLAQPEQRHPRQSGSAAAALRGHARGR